MDAFLLAAIHAACPRLRESAPVQCNLRQVSSASVKIICFLLASSSFFLSFLPWSLDPSSSATLSANQRAPRPLSYFHIARIITKYEAAVAARRRNARTARGRAVRRPPVGEGAEGGRARARAGGGGRARRLDRREGGRAVVGRWWRNMI